MRLVAGLCLLLLGKMHIDTAQASSIAGAAATLAGAIAAVVIDLVIHSKRFVSMQQAVLALMRQGAAATPDEAKEQLNSTTSPTTTPDTMWPGTTKMLLIAILVPFAFWGCGATPKRQAFIAEGTTTSALNIVTSSHQSGLISDRDFLALSPFMDAVIAAQNRVNLAAAAGDKLGLQTALQALADATATLSRERLALTTKPKGSP
jgi:hypothetical protein